MGRQEKRLLPPMTHRKNTNEENRAHFPSVLIGVPSVVKCVE